MRRHLLAIAILLVANGGGSATSTLHRWEGTTDGTVITAVLRADQSMMLKESESIAVVIDCDTGTAPPGLRGRIETSNVGVNAAYGIDYNASDKPLPSGGPILMQPSVMQVAAITVKKPNAPDSVRIRSDTRLITELSAATWLRLRFTDGSHKTRTLDFEIANPQDLASVLRRCLTTAR